MESLAMGAYGVYVWSSFGLMFTVVCIMVIQARLRHTRMVQLIKTGLEIQEANK